MGRSPQRLTPNLKRRGDHPVGCLHQGVDIPIIGIASARGQTNVGRQASDFGRRSAKKGKSGYLALKVRHPTPDARLERRRHAEAKRLARLA